jgi:murein DD-endopeptidase MepM/ murein hydrolase activator NlpD
MRMILGITLALFTTTIWAADRPELPEIGYPLAEVKHGELRSQFKDKRRGHIHQAIDLMRPRGTPVLAVTGGTIRKLARSKTGGISIYLFDETGEYSFFYCHLDHYAKNLHEGQEVQKGEVIGYVGYTGNASRAAPHLHFAVSLTGPQRKWWGEVALDPYPLLLDAAPQETVVEENEASARAGAASIKFR